MTDSDDGFRSDADSGARTVPYIIAPEVVIARRAKRAHKAVEADSVGGHEAVPAACERFTPQIELRDCGGTCEHSHLRHGNLQSIQTVQETRSGVCDTRLMTQLWHTHIWV